MAAYKTGAFVRSGVPPPPPGSTSPTLFEKWCGLFYVPQEPV